MLSSRVNCWILRAVFVFLPAAAEACDWVETNDTLHIESGTCTLHAIAKSETIEAADRIATATATIRVGHGATFVIDGIEFDELRLLSTPDVRANLIAEGATLRVRDIVIKSYDPATNGPDLTVEDGRAFIRVDAFVDADGEAADGRLEVERSRISYLGYDSRHVHLGTYSSYGISLKVKNEEHLRRATITGHIVNSTLSHNYRGFYSYGARDFEIRDSEIHNNLDYGVDGHDDTDRLVVIGNLVHSNGGTGVICSRRCDKNIFENNHVYENGANGIVLHDISTGGSILNNSVYDNIQDGIVIHDSQGTLVFGNEIRGNRYGLRIFSGSAVTLVEKNQFGSNSDAEIFLKHGNLAALSDLSDYSNGPNWNSQNIARHNSSRVWGTEIVGNTFNAPARVVVRGANFLSFGDNNYAAGVSFDIRSSDNVELDGADSKGPVRYLLRADREELADYRIEAPSGAEISMTGSDRVSLTGHRRLMPTGADFRMHFDGGGPGELSLGVPDRTDIRSGVLVDLPIAPVSGAATIIGYRETFSAERTIAMSIAVDPSGSFSLKAFHQMCASVKWTLPDRSFLASSRDIIELDATENKSLILECLAILQE